MIKSDGTASILFVFVQNFIKLGELFVVVGVDGFDIQVPELIESGIISILEPIHF